MNNDSSAATNVKDPLDGLSIKDEHLARVLRGQEFLVQDGAMGTMIQAAGLDAQGQVADLLNLTDPDAIAKIHAAYVDAGAQMITTNTFSANSLKLEGAADVADVYKAAADCARAAGARYVAADIGPTGALLEPFGPMSFDEAYEIFAEQAVAAREAGCDIVAIETMSDLLEAKAALLAVKDNCNLPVFVTMTFEEDGRTFLGTPPEVAAVTLSALGASAVGINCSLGPAEMKDALSAFCKYASVPVIVRPNAGLPRVQDGVTVYDVTPDMYIDAYSELLPLGVSIVGGCCGTNPDYIRLLAQKVAALGKPAPRNNATCATFASTQNLVALDSDAHTITVVGERINPTGKPKLKEALCNGDLDYVVGLGIEQRAAGADMLDVNVGLPEIDEPSMLAGAVQKLQSTVGLPLVIDSSDPQAIETAARIYAGKPLINSVNGKRENLEAILPIVKRYGCAVIGLTLDEAGIPKTAEARLEIARRIVDAAATYGIPSSDIVIDCLTMAAATNQPEAPEILHALQLIKSELGVKTILGVSNISFGLPQRMRINSAFLAAAFGAGLDMAIINPSTPRYRDVVEVCKIISGQDKSAAQYIKTCQSTPDPYDTPKDPTPASTTQEKTGEGGAISTQPSHAQAGCAITIPDAFKRDAAAVEEICEFILAGRKSDIAKATQSLIADYSPLDIIDGIFIPTLDEVGARFEDGRFFLPQLLSAAEAVSAGFDVVESAMGESAPRSEDKTIVLATVKGDIHDIGKNIVAMLLRNYGYNVVDLGRDVAPEAVIEAARESNAGLIGLSALMTTTVKSMEETICLAKAELPDVPIMVGGAVLTPEYSDMIGADYYSKDAAESARIAAEVFA